MGWIWTEILMRYILPLGGTTGCALLAAMVLSAAACPPAWADGEGTIIDDWDSVPVPPPPELSDVSVSAARTALLILDVQNRNCNAERRPRCVASLPRIMRLLEECRSQSLPVVYTLTSNASPEDIREEVRPRADEPVVASGVDKFYGTDLEQILRGRGIETVVLVGTSAHGAVLNTATGAALRGLEVIVPIDGMSASEPWAEQYTAWHLANSPGTRNRVRLTTISRVSVGP
ncbi:MAG: cysteine hydrolase [Armatimonadota bacterium]